MTMLSGVTEIACEVPGSAGVLELEARGTHLALLEADTVFRAQRDEDGSLDGLMRLERAVTY